MPRVNKVVHPRPRGQRPKQRVRRRAAAMAVVLICLLVVMLIGGTLVRGMLLQHRQTKTTLLQVQALWLAESAAALAVQQLQADPLYLGQTWRAAIDEQSSSFGVAEISVESVDQLPQQRIIRIKSIYPDDPVHRVVLENEITLTLPVLGDPA